MADKKVSALAAINTLSADDLLMVVNDPAGTPESKKVTVGNLFGNVAVSTTHTGITTFSANTNHTGTTATFSANVVVGGVNVKDGINDRMQVANTNVFIVSSNARISDLEINFSATANTLTTNTANISTVANTASLIINTRSADPATSNAVTESITAGSVFYSNTFLYIATDINTIKRVALSTF